MSERSDRRKRFLAVAESIAARCHETAEAHPSWPCRRGCDDCCRSLAEVPTLTRAEWELLEDAIEALPAEVRAGVHEGIRALEGREGKIVCPMLERERGECLVYPARPAACRTYGFYVERADILGCAHVVDAAARLDPHDVVWGNQHTVDAALASPGDPPRALWAWLASTR